MRKVEFIAVVRAVKKLALETNYKIDPCLKNMLQEAVYKETSPLGKDVLEQVLSNAQIASEGKFPLCQDTGIAVVFLEIGEEVHIAGGSIYEAINRGIRQGYKEGYLRNSVVSHPLNRKNTGDNTPAVIHTYLVPGDKVSISLMAKGGGSENMSAVDMLTPADGLQGVENFVLKTVAGAGPNPCPPLIVGVGIGGNLEVAPLLAKKALLRPLGEESTVPEDRELERSLLDKINDLGIGPQGFGGRTTALAVNILTYPCHIASLPVAVNLNCHSARHSKVTI